jgi:hypothetical protein
MSEINGLIIVALAAAISATIFNAALWAFKGERSLTIVALAVWAMIVNAALWLFNLPHISMHLT